MSYHCMAGLLVAVVVELCFPHLQQMRDHINNHYVFMLEFTTMSVSDHDFIVLRNSQRPLTRLSDTSALVCRPC